MFAKEPDMPSNCAGSNNPQSPIVGGSTADGFREIIAPFGCHAQTPAEIDLERRWQSEWNRRNVED